MCNRETVSCRYTNTELSNYYIYDFDNDIINNDKILRVLQWCMLGNPELHNCNIYLSQSDTNLTARQKYQVL